MRLWTPRPIAIAALCLATAFAGVPACAMPGVPPEGALSFTVRKAGNEIGHHRVTFAERDGALIVDTEAALKVRIAFVTVYRYTQRTREVWRDGTLAAIESDIDDNGTPFRLRGETRDGKFHLEGHQEDHVLHADVPPISYWNIGLMRARRGFDVQWGSLADLTVEARGVEARQIAGKAVDARRFSMRGYEIRKGERLQQPWLNVDAWYDPADRLVALSFHYKGFDFDYVLQ